MRRSQVRHSGPLAQAGCGVGNTVFPVLETKHRGCGLRMRLFAPCIVPCAAAFPCMPQGGCMPLWQISHRPFLTEHVPSGSVDFCSLIFVLSAIDPGKMPQVQRLHAAWRSPISAINYNVCLT